MFSMPSRLVQVLHLAFQARFLFLGELGHAPVFAHSFQQLQPLDGFLQRGPIRQRAAKPAMVHKIRAAALGFFGNGFLGLALGAYKQHGPAVGGNFAHEAARFAEHLESFLKINNVNAVAFPENIFLHFGVPAARLVAKVHSSLQQLLHGNFYCQVTSSKDSCLRQRIEVTRDTLQSSLLAGILPAVISITRLSPDDRNSLVMLTSAEALKHHKKLTLRELEALARALLPVFLAFLHTGVARQKTVGTQCRAQLRIESRNGAR